jgi:hypothetical protein
MLEDDIIRYVDSNEVENSLIAMSSSGKYQYHVFIQHADNVRYLYVRKSENYGGSWYDNIINVYPSTDGTSTTATSYISKLFCSDTGQNVIYVIKTSSTSNTNIIGVSNDYGFSFNILANPGSDTDYPMHYMQYDIMDITVTPDFNFINFISNTGTIYSTNIQSVYKGSYILPLINGTPKFLDNQIEKYEPPNSIQYASFCSSFSNKGTKKIIYLPK